eukprot:594152-Hanusia_phi.AAC.1
MQTHPQPRLQQRSYSIDEGSAKKRFCSLTTCWWRCVNWADGLAGISKTMRSDPFDAQGGRIVAHEQQRVKEG